MSFIFQHERTLDDVLIEKYQQAVFQRGEHVNKLDEKMCCSDQWTKKTADKKVLCDSGFWIVSVTKTGVSRKN